MCQVPFITPKKECISCLHRHYYHGKYPWNCYIGFTRKIKVLKDMGAPADPGKGYPNFPVLEGLKPCSLLTKKVAN